MSARLGARQLELLGRIIASNGGGVSCYGENVTVYRSLEKRGLIQGKSGQPYCAVHTREGLKFWNEQAVSA